VLKPQKHLLNQAKSGEFAVMTGGFAKKIGIKNLRIINIQIFFLFSF
jgi:hypothetical protein